MVVLAAVAVAGLLGMALLSSAAMHAQTSGNAGRAASAEYLAESALQTATYYLQNRSKMPATWGTTPGHWIYVSGQTLSNVSGSFDIDVTATATPDKYTIKTVGRTTGTAAIARTATATVTLTRQTPQAAASFAGAIAIPPRHTISGNLISIGLPNFQGTGTITNGMVRTSFNSTDYIVPTSATINWYGAGSPASDYTLPDGTTGTPQVLAAAITSFPAAAANNPGHVFYSTGALSVAALTPLTLNGTLVVRGNLTVNGPNSVTLTPQSGMPALVVQNQVRMNSLNCTLRLNGVGWLGTGTAWLGTNTNSFLILDGALLMPNGAGLGSTALGTATLTFNAAKANVASLTIGQDQPVVCVRLLDWKQ
jgi:hypothetical protein